METFTLQNGLTVHFLRKKKTGRVRAQMLYHFGSCAEVSHEERGLAHVVEHMIFKGTKRNYFLRSEDVKKVCPNLELSNAMLSRDELEKLIDKSDYDTVGSLTALHALHLSESDIDSLGRMYGASLNAFTSLEQTSYYFETTPGNIVPFLQIFANSAASTHFQNDQINSELKAVLQEMKMGNDNAPRMAVQKAMELTYGVNEIGHLSTIGSELDLMKLNKTVVTNFFQKYYHPWNATLFLVGEFDPDHLRPLVHEYFQTIGRNEYQGKTAVEALEQRVYGKNNSKLSAALTEVMTKVDSLTNQSYRRVLLGRCRDMEAAIQNKCTSAPTSLKAVIPPPMKQHVVQYRPACRPLWVYSWRLPKGIPTAVTRGLELLTGGGHDSRLEKALVSTGKVASVAVFCDTYRHAGTLTALIRPLPTSDQSLVENMLVSELTRPVTAKEVVRANNQLNTEWTAMQENVQELTTTWVQQYDREHPERILEKPVMGDVTTAQAAISRTRSILVELQPFQNDHDTAEFGARQKVRQENAGKVQSVKNRVTAIVPPYSRRFFPRPTPLKRLSMPCADNEVPDLWKNETILFHPTSRMMHVRVHPKRAREHALTDLANSVGMYCVEKEAISSISVLEHAGAAFGRNSLTIPAANKKRVQCVEKFLLMHQSTVLDADVLENAKRVTMEGLKQAETDAMSVAHHELANIFQRADPYSFQDAIDYVEALSMDTVNAELTARRQHQTTMIMHPGEVFPEPADCGCGGGDDDEKETDKKVVPVLRHIPLNRTQSVVVLARKGSFKTTCPVEYMRKHDLLYHIVFHSLGSRLYDIRKKTGIFYGAGGALGVAANTKNVGYDYLLTRVETQDVERVTGLLRDMLTTLRTNPGIEAHEVEAAKRWYESTWVQRIADISSCCSAVHDLQRLFPKENWQKLPTTLMKKANETTAAMMNEVAKSVFDNAWDVEIVVGN